MRVFMFTMPGLLSFETFMSPILTVPADVRKQFAGCVA